MTRILFIIVLIISSLGIKAQEVRSLWYSTPVKIDGDPSEWPQPFRCYDGETKLQFAAANATANIYVCLKITDEAAQLRLFDGGLELWLDRKGKKKETTGIMFPLKHERMEGGEGGQKHHQH